MKEQIKGIAQPVSPVKQFGIYNMLELMLFQISG